MSDAADELRAAMDAYAEMWIPNTLRWKAEGAAFTGSIPGDGRLEMAIAAALLELLDP